MPKITFGVKKPETTNQNIRYAIMYKQVQKGISAEKLATTARIATSTLYQRMQRPEAFRLCELRAIAKKLDIELPLLVMGKLSESEVN